MKKVYLAGPDVFASNATELAEKHKSLCRAHGFEPLHPVDQIETTAQSIYQRNAELIHEADALIANANPFRGAEPDSGTVFEIGYAVALGKPVIIYLQEPLTTVKTVEKFYGPVYYDQVREQWVDQSGYMIEDFNLPLNLMLSIPCEIVTGSVLEALLALQKRWYD
ncbi:MAG TPA: nucleoside 2-deoxyribosyltransferase [Paenalcaligenes sp.]|nr:nucleoside 2-deoxyribosyltransferase [Paenalcaligenes sp.]